MTTAKSIVNMRRDPTNRKPCWLVWSLQTSGLTQLRAIDTSAFVAGKHVKAAGSENGVIRAWVEERDMDHLYGHADITQYQITNRQDLIQIADALRTTTATLRRPGAAEKGQAK